MSKARARERAKRKAMQKLKKTSSEPKNPQSRSGGFDQRMDTIRNPKINADVKNIAIKAKGAARSR